MVDEQAVRERLRWLKQQRLAWYKGTRSWVHSGQAHSEIDRLNEEIAKEEEKLKCLATRYSPQ